MLERWGMMVVAGMLALSLVSSPTASAQDSEPEEMEPATPVEETDEEERSGGGIPFRLFLSFAAGSHDGEPLNTSVIRVQDSFETDATFDLPDQGYGRAEIGWKLPEQKGDFRLTYGGFREDSYVVNARGLSSQVAGVGQNQSASDLVQWWSFQVEDGRLRSQRTPRTWSSANDTNGNGEPDPDEIMTLAPDVVIDKDAPSNLNNRLQHVDLLYGRVFGGRRWSSRWWGGLRYFDYEGQVLQPAWLGYASVPAGVGFSDGSFLSPLLVQQEASGLGPTGIWEVHLNFAERLFTVYARAQAAFVIAELAADTGVFYSLTPSLGGAVLVPARLQEERDKSTWQNSGELGIRSHLKAGVTLEAGYSIHGFLDTLLLPNLTILPDTPNQLEGTALFSTQDYDTDGWHVRAAFQF